MDGWDDSSTESRREWVGEDPDPRKMQDILKTYRPNLYI
jgi:hypothetical protein